MLQVRRSLIAAAHDGVIARLSPTVNKNIKEK
jgi:hypothetical protein